MKKSIIALLFVFVLLAAGAAAVYFAVFRYDRPEKDLKLAFDGMMTRNGEVAGRYMDYKAFDRLGGEGMLRDSLMRDFSYEVTDLTAQDKNHAVATITVSNRDIETLYGNFVVDAYQFVISEAYRSESERLSDEDLRSKIDEMLMEDLADNEVHLRPREIQVEMTRTDKTWFIDFDTADFDAIYGGYLTAHEHAQTLLGDMSGQALVNVENAYASNIDDADHVLRNAAHFIVDDLWNGVLCNIVSCINAGTDRQGNDYDLEKGMKQLDTMMTEKVTYDVYIGNLSEIEYGNVKTGWKNLSDNLSRLVHEIKAAKPKPVDYNYLPDTSKFEAAMDQFVSQIYQTGAEAETEAETE